VSRITITIICDNAAFDDEGGGSFAHETLAVIMRASRWAMAQHGAPLQRDELKLYDTNGNPVGALVYTPDDS
jgi:hypothetical protein